MTPTPAKISRAELRLVHVEQNLLDLLLAVPDVLVRPAVALGPTLQVAAGAAHLGQRHQANPLDEVGLVLVWRAERRTKKAVCHITTNALQFPRDELNVWQRSPPPAMPAEAGRAKAEAW